MLVLLATVLAACGGKAAPTEPPSALYFQEGGEAGFVPAEAPVMEEPAAQEADAASEASVVYNTGADAAGAASYDRMIIKNAEINLLVKNSEAALDGVTQLVSDVRGYIASSQTWYEEHGGVNYKYATLTIGIPADQFETSLRRLRNLAIRVLNETASGQDVTDQYVDLQSQLTNLEATRDRIKSFLDQAKTVDEALKINEQLSEIEGQIEEIKGRMNYLKDRSAFSTITVYITPDLPPATPTPSPTPRPTATPIPWKPGETAKESWDTLTVAYHGIIDFLIWFGIVLVPILAPWIFLGWLAWRLLSRRKPKA
jgi:hypothetical protein